MNEKITDAIRYDHLIVKTKIWLEDDDGRTIIGFGLLSALDAIEEAGSMNAAAKKMKMGYRSLWGKIKKAEDRIGRPLLMKQVGGAAGGHSDLMPFARDLVDKFRLLNKQVEESVDKIFHNVFDEG